MIILLGFPKSGTTSFTYLFNKLGYKSYHWVFRNDTDYVGGWIKKCKDRNEKLLSWIPKHPKNKIAVTHSDAISSALCFNKRLLKKYLKEQINILSPKEIIHKRIILL